MMEKSEAEEFDEEDAEESVADDSELDHLIRDVEKQRRKAAKGGQEPHWRRLERVMEDKRTAELLSDFDDYDIGDGAAEAREGGTDKKKKRREG